MTVISIGQLWESVANANLFSSDLDYMDFALADEDIVASEDLTKEELTASISKKETIADDSASDVEGDDVCAPRAGTSTAAIVAVTTLRMYQGSKRAFALSWTIARSLF